MASPPTATDWNSAPLLETVVTSIDLHGNSHVATLGPRVAGDYEWLLLRPYEGTTTLANLLAQPHGVMHIVDDVELLVRAALPLEGELDLQFAAVAGHACPRLMDCCRWYAFEVVSHDVSHPRAELVARVVASGQVREFIGWHRARHAVIEAAIVASRLHLLPRDEVARQLQSLRTIVDKTAGPAERRALALVEEFIARNERRAST